MNNQYLPSFNPSGCLWSCVVPTWVRVEALCARWSSFPATASPFVACRPVGTMRTTTPSSPTSRGSTTRPQPSSPARLWPSDTGWTGPQRPAAAARSARPPGRARRRHWPEASPQGRWWWREAGGTLASGWGENWPVRGCLWSFWTRTNLPVMSLMERSSIRYGTVERDLTMSWCVPVNLLYETEWEK